MKNIFTYLAVVTVMFITACSSDNFVTEDGETRVKEGTEAAIHALESGDASRSMLYLQDGKMHFEWNVGDRIAVYPKYVEGIDQPFDGIGTSQVQNLTYVSTVTSGKDGVVDGMFSVNSEKFVLYVENTTDFVAWTPSFPDPDDVTLIVPDRGYTDMLFSYQNQIQTANVQMGHYVTGNAGEMAQYLESEKAASAHLGAYDYMYSEATQENSGYTYFDFTHLQATVRFYMKIPDADSPQIFDSLIVYHKFDSDIDAYHFVTRGKFDLSTMQAKELTTVSKVKLMLGSANGGMDLIDHEEGSTTKGKYKSDYERSGGYYLIAYMQMYPVDITMDDMQNPTLYLCGHTGSEATGNLKKNFYKARLEKKNILAGKWYQWATTLDEDQPIEFEVVSVQEWEADDTFYNTVNKQEGQGTQDW